MAKAKSAVVRNDDDGFQSAVRKNTKNGGGGKKKRLYVGNLPSLFASEYELKMQLSQFLRERGGLGGAVITIHNHGKPSFHGFVEMPEGMNDAKSIDGVISKLHRTNWHGKRIVVQRERKKQNGGKGGGFGGRGWSKPETSTSAEERQGDERQQSSVSSAAPCFVDDSMAIEELAAAVIGGVVAEEVENSTVDPTVTTIASTAAVTLALSALLVADENNNNDDNDKNVADLNANAGPISVVDNEIDDDNVDFATRIKQQSMSALMADYGQEDLNWQEKKVDETLTQEQPDTTTTHAIPSRLGQHGKAPIHVELVSFGYHFGVPADVSSKGWSHAHPLPAFDTRSIDEEIEVPQYLAWQDGLSGAVKRVLLQAHGTKLRKMARQEIAPQVEAAIEQAVEEGGYGYAMPLNISVYVGCPGGRHVSVVVAELAATALRQRLRTLATASESGVVWTSSVGTRHRDIERGNNRNNASQRKLRKREEDEDDW